MTEPHPATQHFLADYDDLPNLAEELFRRVAGHVTVYPVKWDSVERNGERPHDVLATTWKWLDASGPLKESVFFLQLHNALDDLADTVKKQDAFRPFPLTHKPPTTYGRAYHDYHLTGPPIDVRFIIAYEPLGDAGLGLSFHIVTLVQRGSIDDA